ncbi:TauD/TfdA family dioxygenase [Ramlibacter sp.]|uniref:TauD/TfdA family dioxygenase n=1 Tax=Ramlibacter sp. TaxID=1917967 RepID=UPI0017CEB8D8|nr:TauD/TfdA family dioxygenase [Ramlibacter sp.]MBA2674936.1 TauD/TfdA family dioxygenase [Ramlibacter sp.]
MNPNSHANAVPLAVLDDRARNLSFLRDDPDGFAAEVQALRRRHGAVLIRGLDFATPAEVEEIARAICGGMDLLSYDGERATPRTALGGRVYTSTEYKAGESIFVHNECSSRLEWPLCLMFACGLPAAGGGATPLCDMRQVTRELDPAIQAAFRARGIAYTRNYGGEFGVSIEYAFGTTDRAAIAAYCAARGIGCEWLGPDALRTRFRRASHALHPETGETLWFNYATFYSRSALDPRLRRLMRGVPEERRAFSAAWADGEPIPEDMFDACRQAFDAATYRFDWRRGDFLLLDNMLSGHGRDPFQGERLTYTVMAGEVVRPAPTALPTILRTTEELAPC